MAFGGGAEGQFPFALGAVFARVGEGGDEFGIMLETGPIERFAAAGNYVSYCRAVKAEKLSNGRKKGENHRKCGNPYLVWAWLEAANFALRYSPEIKRWYQRKVKRCGGLTVVALKAVAAKLAKAAYYMLKNQEAFKLEQVFG